KGSGRAGLHFDRADRLKVRYASICGPSHGLACKRRRPQMASRPIGNGNISFGLVSIPVKLFSATRSKSVSFNLLHKKDQSRIQQKIYCPVDDAIIDRSELVRGYEIEKGRYVTFTDEELKNLEAREDHAIEITEFVPLAAVDPVYFEDSFYLGAEVGAGKAYRLLCEALSSSKRVALGRF